ncbi:hypothetical protein [Bacillus sp. JJ722]|uniref:hypothetical protein n=1 Tax=Bacillus sp. JJ722 TaxID=3122973 RepID=UPI0030009F4F
MAEEKELSAFQQAVKLEDHARRLKEVEDDMKNIKPIVYETSSSVKSIKESVKEMKDNTKIIKNAFIGSAIAAIFTVITGVIVFAINN